MFLQKLFLNLRKVICHQFILEQDTVKKMYEVLVTQEEMTKAIDLPGFFKIPADNRNLNYDKFIEKGSQKDCFIRIVSFS